MRHWRLFEDLFDMQADANRFFDDVYRRLAMFELAMDRWNALDTLDAQRQAQMLEGLAGRSVFTERTERRMVVEDAGQPRVLTSQRAVRQVLPQTDAPVQAIPSQTEQAAVDVFEDTNGVTIRAGLPGLQPGDIQLAVQQNTLQFSGKIDYTIPLPEGVDATQIRASYRNGLLEVKLPKPPRGREIEVIFEETDPEPYY